MRNSLIHFVMIASIVICGCVYSFTLVNKESAPMVYAAEVVPQSTVPEGYVHIIPNTLYENVEYYIDVTQPMTYAESNITTKPYISAGHDGYLDYVKIYGDTDTSAFYGSVDTADGWNTSVIVDGIVTGYPTLNINLPTSPDWLYVKVESEPQIPDGYALCELGVEYSGEFFIDTSVVPDCTLRVSGYSYVSSEAYFEYDSYRMSLIYTYPSYSSSVGAAISMENLNDDDRYRIYGNGSWDLEYLGYSQYVSGYVTLSTDLNSNNWLYYKKSAPEPVAKSLTITFDDGVESVSYGNIVWTESGQAQSVTFDAERGVYTFDVVYKDGSHLNTYLFDAFGDVECNLNEENDLVFRFVENLGTEYLISIDITTLPLKKDLYIAFDSGIESVSCGNYVWDVSQEAVLITYPENAADFTFTVKLAEGYRIVAVSYVFYGDTENILNAEWSGSSFTINVAKGQALSLISIMTEQSIWTSPLTITFDEGVEKVTCGDLTWTESGQSHDITYDFSSGEAQTLTFTVTFKEGYTFSDYTFEQTGGITSSRDGNVLTFSYSIDNAALSSLALTSFKYRQELTINWDIGIEQISSNGVTWFNHETHSYDFNQDSVAYYFDVALDLDEYFIESVGMGYSTDAVIYDGFSEGKLKFLIPEGEFLAQINIAVGVVPKENGILYLVYPKYLGNSQDGFESNYKLSDMVLELSGGYVIDSLEELQALVTEYFTEERMPAGDIISLVNVVNFPVIEELSFPFVIDGDTIGALFSTELTTVKCHGIPTQYVYYLGYLHYVDEWTDNINHTSEYVNYLLIPQFVNQSQSGKLLFYGYGLDLNDGDTIYIQIDGERISVDIEVSYAPTLGSILVGALGHQKVYYFSVEDIPDGYYLHTVDTQTTDIVFVFSKTPYSRDNDFSDENLTGGIDDNKGGISGIGNILTTLGWVAGIGLIGYVVLSVLPDRRRR